MKTQYTQLRLKERHEIEDGLNQGLSFRKIAKLLDRNPSTISREVRENRTIRAFKPRLCACKEKHWCIRINVCGECTSEGMWCSQCTLKDCRTYCDTYASQSACARLNVSPWVCNGCKKNRYGCTRHNRYIYDASVAHKAASERRSDARKGIDMSPDRAASALLLIKDGLSRGLSPYEISVLYEHELAVHRSTIYRWVEAGYGGLTNLELERKVGFRPRKKNPRKKSTPHSKKRSYSCFEKLPSELRGTRSELDCVLGKNTNTQAVLTLYNLPTHMQLAFLLTAQNFESVKRELLKLKTIMPKSMYDRWMRIVLTDNGDEFCDEATLGQICGECIRNETLELHLYYCDPCQSQQKGSCEKNHTEIRQILEKGMFDFDELNRCDLSVLMSHANSNPRKSLGDKSPLQMLKFVYGQDNAQKLMDALEIKEMSRDELYLKPEILNIERAKRGEAPLTQLK